ncbi:MAG: hypothetical protein FVQ83_10775 [Chloroflexi bacterium]|nr:hypothetical protein [Chloroflexota bacterium]
MTRVILLFALFIPACSGSPSEGDVQTAIALTQSSENTAVSIIEEGISQTQTASAPTRTLIPTVTLTPTVTITPTETEIPEIPLRDLALTFSDLVNVEPELATQWGENPVEVDCFDEGDNPDSECYAITYLSDVYWSKPFTIEITRFKYFGSNSRNSANEIVFLQYGRSLDAPSYPDLPGSFWIGEMNNGTLIFGFSTGNIAVLMYTQIPEDFTGELLVPYYSLLGQAQYQKIRN